MAIADADHEGKNIFKRRRSCTSINEVSSIQSNFPDFKSNLGLKFYQDEIETNSSSAQSSENVSINDDYKQKISLKSISVIRRELSESSLGWPLRRRISPEGQKALGRSKGRSMSLIDWVMSLPTRSSETIMKNLSDSNSETNIFFHGETENSVHSSENQSLDKSGNGEDEESGKKQQTLSGSFSALTEEESTKSTFGWPLLSINTSTIVDSLDDYAAQANTNSQLDLYSEAPRELPLKLDLVLKLKSSGCKQFSYKELELATRKFSAENLIGEGGCSNVYKGCIGKCKPVAIKVLKQYKEAWNDFFLEVDIMSSLKHKNITHLIGVCMDDNHPILVYDFLLKGSLEERLHNAGNEKSILPWKSRFKVAIAVAEALNYLHNGCSHPVIHRDVKSSNILLARDLQPQLSDFGLATWGPEDAAYTLSSSEIVGTFGYIAPEYFMYGRVSDKTDIYSYGIVLLELLTGKKPISSKGLKGQEILVMWAMPLLESGNLEALVDPKLGDEFDNVQMHKMVLAATLCIKLSPKLRPKASEILKLLRKEKEVREWMNDYVNDLAKPIYEEFDDIFPENGHKQSSDSSFLGLDGDDASSLNSSDSKKISLESVEQSYHFKLKDYLKEQQG